MIGRLIKLFSNKKKTDKKVTTKTTNTESGTANWNPNSHSEIWNDPSNWLPNSVPTDSAYFAESEITQIGFSADSQAEIGSIQFNQNAPAFNLNFDTEGDVPILTISGVGVINHGTNVQNITVKAIASSNTKPQLRFSNQANAGGSNMLYYAGPTSLLTGYGGGVISFVNEASAGTAKFEIKTGAVAPPKGSTVGAEIAFLDNASAAQAKFTVYGSLGKDGDTFANAVFHNNAHADKATFTNMGGTVSGGDGGNTQFYDQTNAGYATYNNYGGTVDSSNGGDVAFDGTASANHGTFTNKAALVSGAYGGVTSFNNNWPDVSDGGATAANGTFNNEGAGPKAHGGGGHTEFTAKYGSPTAANGTFNNYGSTIATKSSAGHTIFSISDADKIDYAPDGGNAIFNNYPAETSDGAAGYTEFAMYNMPADYSGKVPTAGAATIYNHGSNLAGACGGYTSFGQTTDAGTATLIAYGGKESGGKIAFYDQSTASKASILLHGNGKLDLTYHSGSLTIDKLEVRSGSISSLIGTSTTTLIIEKFLDLFDSSIDFYFEVENSGFKPNTTYKILTAPNLGSMNASNFKGNQISGIEPTFEIIGQELFVNYKQEQ